MKTKFTAILIGLIVFLTIKCYSESIWEGGNFPQIQSSITALAIRGTYIYVGTSADGFFYSSDNGATWNQPTDKLATMNIKLIVLKGNDLVFVISENLIQKTSDNGANWKRNAWFMEVQEVIKSASVGPSGNLYIGTDKNVWKSIDDALRFTKISTKLEKVDVPAMAVNSKEQLFITNHIPESGAIYRTDDIGVNWAKKQNGIKSNYKAKFFFVCDNDLIYCLIQNEIYFSTDNGEFWTYLELPNQDLPITKIRPNRFGDLLVLQRNKVSIWDIKKRKWIADHSDLDTPDGVEDVGLDDDGKVRIVTGKGIFKSNISLSDIIKKLNLSYDCKVINANGNPVANTKLNLYLNDALQGQVTTNEAGIFSTDEFPVKLGDILSINKKLEIVPAIKSGHNDVDNTMAEIFIDNSQIDQNGTQTEFELETEYEPILKLNHTTLRYNLVVSVEWDANQAFLDTLASQLRKLSNYLYDVTDGQLYFNQVEIYDSKVNWNNSDIQIFANNMVWPNANVGAINSKTGQVHMPRLWLGNSDPSRNTTANDNWIETPNYHNYRTIGHELGHYLFGFWDEYVYADEDWGAKVPEYYNYGFMDYQYLDGDQYSSEMSAEYQYSHSKYYKSTAQWVYNGSACWEQFENAHEKNYSNIFANIYKPIERTGSSSKIVGGPNSVWNKPDCDVGKKMICNIHNNDNGGGTAEVVCYLGNGPFANVDLVLYRKGLMNIYILLPQGRTADNGHALILGAKPGDKVRCSFVDENQNELWSGWADIYAVTPIEGNNQLLAPSVDVNMKKANGNFILDNEISFNTNRNLEFISKAQKVFENSPKIETFDEENGSLQEDFILDSKSGKYKYEFKNDLKEQFSINLLLYDDNKEEISVPIDFKLNSNTVDVNSFNGDLKFYMDSQNSSGIDIVPVASTKIPCSKNGLNIDAERGSNLFYIKSYPKELPTNSKNIISIRYEKSRLFKKSDTLLSLYKWNYNNEVWEKLPSYIDTAQKTVSAVVNSTGCYTLFTFDPNSGIKPNNDRGMLDLNVNPNPTREKANISFVNDENRFINITITDLYGREVCKLAQNQYYSAGRKEISYNTSELTDGIYFCILKSDNIVQSKAFIVKH